MTISGDSGPSVTLFSCLLVITMVCTHFDYVTASSASVNGTTRLIRDVIGNYDHRLRPILNQTEPVDVYFTFFLLSLLEVDEIEQRIHINAWINFSWWDEIRTWDPSDYNGIDVLHPDPLDVWRPRTIIANSIGPRDIFADNYAPFSILPSGSTTWAPGAIFDLSCDFDLTYFPFDIQTCQARILASDLASEINIIPTQPFVFAGAFTPNGEWDLKATSIAKDIQAFGGVPYYTRATVSFTFERRPTYYLLNVLSPVMVLSFLSLFGFVVPKESGERASFAITVLLSLAVFMGVISGQVPPSSDSFPYISIYIFSLLCLSGFSVFIIVCQLRLSSLLTEDKKDDEPCRQGDNPSSHGENQKYKVDKISNQKYGQMKNIGRVSNTNGAFVMDSPLTSPERGQGYRVTHIQKSRSNHDSGIDSGDVNLSTPTSTHLVDNGRNRGDGAFDKLCGSTNGGEQLIQVPHSSKGNILKTNTASQKTGSARVMKSLCMKLLLEFDDVFLFILFTVAWGVFTILFFNKIITEKESRL